jgi:hypothetical protein
MADLLHRLAARTLGQAPALTPRIPTRFEPAPYTSIVDSETPASTMDSTWPATDRRSTPDVPGVTISHTSIRAGTRMVVGEPRATAQPVPPRAAEPGAPRTSGEPARPGVPAVGVPVAGPAAHAVPATQPWAATTAAATTAAAATAGLPPMPPVARPAASRRSGPAGRPDVHITIGRIEVRAEPAAAQPAATAPTPRPAPRPAPAEPAVLTLAAYLRGDDGRPR